MTTAQEEALLRRIEALEANLAERQRAHEQLREMEQRLRQVIEVSRDAIGVTERGIIVEANEQAFKLFGYATDELIGMGALGLHPPECHDLVRQRVMTGYEDPYETTCQKKDGSTFVAEICGRAIVVSGRPARVTAIRDITARKRVEEAQREAAVREEVIRAQEALIAALSAPVLPIGRGVLVMPLVGHMSRERAQGVPTILAEEVSRRGARVAILDITGVPEVNAQVVDTLLRAARTVQMLGAEVILTGVRAEVARRFVEFDADLGRLTTCATLEQAIAHGLHLVTGPRRQRVPSRERWR
jgi:rsbT co-antagonist protein RsbR